MGYIASCNPSEVKGKALMRMRGTGSIFKQSKSRLWWIGYLGPDGKYVRESSGSDLKSVAQALLESRLGEARKGIDPAKWRDHLYNDMKASLIADYRANNHRSLQTLNDGTVTIWNLKRLDDHFMGWKARSITTEAIDAFVKKTLADGVSKPTVNRSLALLRRMFSLAAVESRNAIQPPYIRFQAENAPRTGFVTLPQFEAIRSHLPTTLHPLVTLLFWTGVRLGEASKILWSEVDLDKSEITITNEQAKNGTARVLPLTDELVGMLKKMFRTEAPVFATTNLTKAWKKATKNADLAGTLIHDLRRSAVMALSEAGNDQSTVMAISGHKTISVFLRYNIASRERLHNAMRRRQDSYLTHTDTVQRKQ